MSAFVTRVAPLWGLQKQVTALRKGMLDRQIEIERLKEEATNAQRIAEDAVDTADRATREHCNVQREMDALRARLAQCEEDGREKSNTISRLQDSVTTFKRRVRRFPIIIIQVTIVYIEIIGDQTPSQHQRVGRATTRTS